MHKQILKTKIEYLEEIWKETREWKPGKNNRIGFYRYLHAVYKFYAQLRKTKGATKKARDKIIKIHISATAGDSLHCRISIQPMSAPGLGCAKTPALAPHVEISLINCISESQNILHTRGSMPGWRIVFSTFRECMSFYTGRVKPGHCMTSAARPLFHRKRKSILDLVVSQMCHNRTHALQQMASLSVRR
jgi:hypothetical protein